MDTKGLIFETIIMGDFNQPIDMPTKLKTNKENSELKSIIGHWIEKTCTEYSIKLKQNIHSFKQPPKPSLKQITFQATN